VDKGVKFSEVEISPRWYFAGVDKTSVNIGYGNDGNQISYDYELKGKTVILKTSGNFERFKLRIPFPEKTENVTTSLNGEKVKSITDNVNKSRYAVVNGKGSANTILLKFN
jgi:hypothetical protein